MSQIHPDDIIEVNLDYTVEESNLTPNEEEGFVDKETTHYLLPDGRYWNIQNAQFEELDLTNPTVVANVEVYELKINSDKPDENSEVTDEPVGTMYTPEELKAISEEILINTLKSAGYNLGEFTPFIYFESKLKQERNERLAATDYLLMPDYTLTSAQKSKLETYRQALRDLPSQPGFPWDGGGSATPWPILDI